MIKIRGMRSHTHFKVNTPDFVRHLAKYADEENDKERTTGKIF
jgi:hypothetical protein